MLFEDNDGDSDGETGVTFIVDAPDCSGVSGTLFKAVSEGTAGDTPDIS